MQCLANEKPLLVMIDDIHWAEPAFLDLLENLVDTIEDAPVLLVATSRHDLLEARAEWGRRERSTRLVLEPLSDDAAAQVVRNLFGASDLPEGLVGRIVAAAEGNPLYVEQMLSMIVDSAAASDDGTSTQAQVDAGTVVPPTIRALLEARVDKLERTERATAEPASVIGMEFTYSAVESLAPQQLRHRLDEQLRALARKRFIYPASDDPDPRYRFDHQLVRDTVYSGLLKRARATMHTEFVEWADKVNPESYRGPEFEAILGYHLEQAYKYLRELGPVDDAGVAIGRDAARRLSSAGHRAFGRGDMHAAANLFRRATQLVNKQDPLRPQVLTDLGEVLMELGDFAESRAVLDEAQLDAEQAKNQRIAASARLFRMRVRFFSAEPGDWGDATLRTAEEAIPLFEAQGAHPELARAWRLIGLVHGVAARYGRSTDAVSRSMMHARLAQDDRLIARNAVGLASSALLGPTPVLQAIELCEQMIANGLGDRQAESKILCTLAQLHAMNGDFDQARSSYRRGRAMLRELGQGLNAAANGIDVLQVELLAGDLAGAEREVMADLAFLEGAGETFYLSTMAALLSRVVRDQGRDEDALAISRRAEEATASDDVESLALWQSTRAPILARAGRIAEAESLARSAVELSLKSDAPQMQADSLSELAAVLMQANQPEEARRVIERAISIYQAKGDVVSAARSLAVAGQLR
jgi:tetratricopeptide (TPR) repeat protein